MMTNMSKIVESIGGAVATKLAVQNADETNKWYNERNDGATSSNNE